MKNVNLYEIIKKYILLPIVYLLILFYIILEEYIWNRIFKYIYLKIKSFNLLARFNSFIKSINNRYLILLIFILPFVFMEVFATLGLIMAAKGLVVLGTFLYILKLFLTVPVVIIFNSAKKKLLSFYIMKISYYGLIKIKRNKIFRNIKRKIKHLKKFFKDSIQKLFK